MTDKIDNPFDSIENAHEYLRLLSANIVETKLEIERDIASATAGNRVRNVDALRLVLYKLDKLANHMTAGQRMLNDLRTLRRLLLRERSTAMPAQSK